MTALSIVGALAIPAVRLFRDFRIDMPPEEAMRDLGKPLIDYAPPMWAEREQRKGRNRLIAGAVVVIFVIGGILS